MGRSALLGLPGTPGQIHDFSPLISPSGRFWTIRAPDSTMQVDLGRVTASWQMKDLPMPDAINLQNSLAGGPTRPGVVSFDVRWSPGPNQRPGKTRDPQNHFAVEFVEGCEATVSWTGRTEGTDFISGAVDPSRPGTFVMLGRERNGVFFS